MKKLLAILLCLTLVFSLVACGGNSSDEPNTNGGANNITNGNNDAASDSSAKTTMTVAIAGDPGTFYPYNNLSGSGRALYTPVYETMFFYDENTEPEPILAESWEIDEDGKGITIKLKEGVLFHDGSEMKASDVLFSIECILKCNWATNIGKIDLENSKAIDDYTVYLKYSEVQGPLLYMLCNLYILSEAYQTSVPEADWTYNCIGTGPYMWDEYSTGSEYHLKKFEGYREEKALEEIVIRIIPESSVQLIELQTGNIDLAMGLSYKDIYAYQEDTTDGVSITWGPAIGSFAMTSALSGEPYDNLLVRQAFAYALNLEACNKIAYSGLAHTATNIYAYGVPVWEEAENLRTYNPEKAKELLIEAGYPDGVTLDLYIVNTTAGNDIAEVLINSCSEAGITLNVKSVDTATLYGAMFTGAPGFYMSVLYTNGDPYIMLSSFGSDLYKELLGYKNVEDYSTMLELFKTAMGKIDDTERYKDYRALMNLSYDNCLTIPVIDLCDVGAHPDNLKGYWMGGPAYHYEDCYWE